ncbi:tape measure protein [Massilia sp. HP4]|uniref:tape measure protein n=1 Tax=Massilia sp. HP4 TaxID=2562316 RepID=UPI0010C123BF|nr:tape measure protein [Massilia sp. HP4]
MSTITNEAVIKITADASGVESGLRQVEAATARTGKNLENLGATAQKTGKSLESLGAGPGLRNVGDGAGAAAGQVDRATKSMADSIQRATATMNAGAKGSAAYYEALANTRGLNITALRPYLDQLDAVTRKTQQAAAAQRQLDAGNNFLAGLRAQAEGIGKTASQLAALRAEQLGVADDARPLIEQLQAAEEAAGNAGNSISGFAAALASVASGAGLAAVVQLSDEYGKYVAQLKLATTGQSEFANAQGAVRRIAAGAQSDLSATGSLYASITKSTRDLGIAQAQVADITETVSLALKVSGASSAEAGSAILQLSQAFASGVLRGDEFNSVNEASPRLMQALADGIGVPVGALRAMAEQGALTTDVLANALPRALAALRTEAKSVESIGGAVTVLKNNLLELVGSTAQSNGVVSVLSGSIGLLAENLMLVGGVVATGALAKLGSMFGVAATKAYENVAASRALAAANLATANTNVAAAAAASATATARVNELRAAVLAAEGNAALAIATNGLIPAQARAAAAAATHTAALTAQATAARAASVSITAARGALALVGGPVGAVITVLGLAATAWAVWGNAAEKANDQATESTEESTAEMIVRLDEQITKLRERNALAATEPRIKALDGISEVDKDGLARAKAALDANKAAQAAAGNDARARMMLQLEEVELSGKYEAALGRVKALQGEVAVAAARTRGERLDDWYAKNGTSAQRLAAELENLKKEFGTIPPEMEKLVRAKFADPAATKAITDQAKAAKEYADLLARISGKSLGVDSDYQENLAKLAAGYKAGKQTLAEYTETLEKYNAQQPRAVQAAKELSDFQAEYSKGLETTSTVYAKRVQDAQDEATRNEDLARTYGMTKSAIEALELARLEEQLAQRATLGLQLDQIEMLEKLIDAKKRSAGAAVRMEGIDAAKKAGEDLDRFLDPTKAQTFGEALKGAFGAAGDSMTQLISGLDAYGIRQAEIDKARKDASVKYATDSKGYADAMAAITAKEVKSRLSGYGDMSAAAKGFFKENSTGYRVMEGAEKAFRAIELANQMQSLYTHLFVTTAKATGTAAGQGAETAAVVAGEAARNTAKVPGVFMSFMSALGPWGMAAAAAAIAAVLGGAFSGGSVDMTAQRQEKQGTGSVLGSDAKSESIARSLEAIEGATLQGLGISNGMLTSLRNIEAGIGQFASLLVRSTGVTGDFGAEFESVGSAAKLGLELDKIGGDWLGKMTSRILGAVFGGKTTVEDTGFMVDRASFATIAAGGLSAMQYADIKKDGGLFGSDKNSTKLEGLGLEGNRQIASVLLSLYDTVLEAGSMLDIGADGFAEQLNRFVVDIGKVSLKGLSDDEIEKELSAVFSKVGDDLAKFGVGGLEQFQKVGEGYLETLTRVATNYQAVAVVTDSLGMTFGSLGLASVGARERLIDLVGGLDEFTSSADQFLSDFYSDKERADALRGRITPTLDQFGIKTGAEDSLQQFRSVVTGLDVTTEAGARAYATLMQIAPAFKQIADVDAKVFEERADLQKQLDELTLSETQLLAKQRAALDESNRALFDQIQAVKAKTAAEEAATAAINKAKSDAAALMGGVDSAFSVLQKVVSRQKQALQDEISVRTASIQKIEALSQSLRSTLDGMTVQGREAEDRQAAQAQIQAALAIAKASGKLPSADDLRNALSVAGRSSADQFATQQDYLRDFYATRAGIEDLAGLTDKSLSAEERSLKSLEDQVKQYDLMLEREQEQIDVLKGISVTGLSIEQALAALHSAVVAAAANPVNSAGSAINDAYKDSLGRAPDQAGLDFWKDQAAGGLGTGAIVDAIKNSPEAKIRELYRDVFGRAPDASGLQFWVSQMNGGMSLSTIRDAMMGSDEKKGLRGFAVGANYIPVDMPAMVHQGERIIPAADNRELMRRLASPEGNNQALAAAVERLTREVEGLRAETRAVATHTEKSGRLLGRVIRNDVLVTGQEG